MAEQAFIPEVEEDDEIETSQQQNTSAGGDVVAVKNSQQPTGSVNNDFEERFLNEKWYGRYKTTQQFVKFENDEWKGIEEDEFEFVQQLWMEQEASEIQVINGVKMKWNAGTQQWEAMTAEIDEDFIAAYQSNYGVEYDYDKMTEEFRKEQEAKQKEREEKKEEKRKRKLEAETKPEGWIDMDDKTTAVYVSNLPLNITDEEFKDFMSKAGLIQLDARTHKPKIKLYRTPDGGLKGDGRCCYIKKESIDVALSILDGYDLNGKTVKVEKAHFEMKGEYDPTKKPRKLTAQQKKSFIERQNRAFEWKPDKPRNYRPKSDCVVIIENMFTLAELNKTPALIFDIKQDLEISCAKFGTVKKVVVYDNNPAGVCSVTFENTEQSDQAVKMLDGREVKGRRLKVYLWDGRTRYKVDETEEEREAREAEWNKFLEGGSDQEEVEEEDRTAEVD